MVVKSQIKLIKSLQQKKYRNRYNLFVAEGIKMVQELLNSDIEADQIFVTEELLFTNTTQSVQLISEDELKKISGLANPNKALGVFKIPFPKKINFSDWVLVLDDVRDPGNLGTIIRLCDWFGIQHLICSQNTVDCYNPKTLQATMGSIARITIGYTDIVAFLKTVEVPVYGADMQGSSIYKTEFTDTGILVMGNEAHGLSKEVEALLAKKISIPHYGEKTAESLNVAMATSILLNEIRRDRNCR
jgi:TrmH family RNA methyltransferase